MKRKLLILSAVSMLGVGMAQAQSMTVGVGLASDANAQQSATYSLQTLGESDYFQIDFSGDAGYDKGDGSIFVQISSDTNENHLLDISRRNGNRTTSTRSKVVISFEQSAAQEGPKANISERSQGYATICSPFIMKVPAEDKGLAVYAPTYNNKKVELNSSTKLAAGTIIPINTPLVVKSTGTSSVNFDIYDPRIDTNTQDPKLSNTNYKQYYKGTILPANKPSSGGTTYTLGLPSDLTEEQVVAFYQYLGEQIPFGRTYLLAPSSNSKVVGFSLDEESTEIDGISSIGSTSKVAYNLNGQRVQTNAKGLVIVNGKKLFNK